jgi:hypothetical protein
MVAKLTSPQQKHKPAAGGLVPNMRCRAIHFVTGGNKFMRGVNADDGGKRESAHAHKHHLPSSLLSQPERPRTQCVWKEGNEAQRQHGPHRAPFSTAATAARLNPTG